MNEHCWTFEPYFGNSCCVVHNWTFPALQTVGLFFPMDFFHESALLDISTQACGIVLLHFHGENASPTTNMRRICVTVALLSIIGHYTLSRQLARVFFINHHCWTLAPYFWNSCFVVHNWTFPAWQTVGLFFLQIFFHESALLDISTQAFGIVFARL